MNTEIQVNSLKEYYEMLTTEELLRIHAEGTLEKPAYSILKKELDARGVTIPKRPVPNDINKNEYSMENKTQKVLASRRSRLWASMIDAILSIAVTVPFIIYFNVWELAANGEIPIEIMINLSVLSWGLFLLMHGYLLKTYGQTIGKNLLGIFIVNLDGSKPDFWPLIIKRYLPLALVGFVPVIGRYMPTIDVLFILREDKRCLHDRIAGTKVIKISKNRSS